MSGIEQNVEEIDRINEEKYVFNVESDIQKVHLDLVWRWKQQLETLRE